MAAATVCSDSGVQENKICHSLYFLPSICHEVFCSIWHDLGKNYHQCFSKDKRSDLVLWEVLEGAGGEGGGRGDQDGEDM